MDDQVVNTPLPLEPISGQFLEPELTLDSRFGSNVPLEDGAHRIRAILYDLQGQEQAAAAVSVSVTRSPAFPPPNYTIDGNAQSWSTLLNQAVTNREPLRETFASFINAWPPPGHCGQDMRSVPGFPAPDAYRHRPLVVYVCPPDKCGGSLDWMRWQEEAAAACGARCLWLDRMACHHYADVVLLSCYAAPPIGFGKWPHQVWAYLCMEADTRRNLLSSNLLRHLDIVANYRLHADFPRLPPAAALQQASSSSSEPPWHVTVTYTPGNFDMYSAFEANAHAQRPHLAAYLVSNCGRPRDLYIARLLEVLGDRVHSLGRCFNNRPMPKASRHGSPTLALLRQYKFTIAIENYLAHDYVSERFYQPLLSGALPVPPVWCERKPAARRLGLGGLREAGCTGESLWFRRGSEGQRETDRQTDRGREGGRERERESGEAAICDAGGLAQGRCRFTLGRPTSLSSRPLATLSSTFGNTSLQVSMSRGEHAPASRIM